MIKYNILDHSQSNIIVLFRDDPEKAFKFIYDEWYEKLCLSAYKMVQSIDASKDIVQEVIMELWKKKDTIDINTSLLAYLQRSVQNRSINYIKAKANNLGNLDALDKIEDGAYSNQVLMEAEELKERITEAIESLPDKCKIVFALSRYQEKSYQEISETLGISIKTVENHISKALKILRKNLSIA